MPIKKCSCTHPSQDELNGPGMRVMNPTTKQNLRCSVCTKEISSERGESKVKTEKGKGGKK